MKFLLCLVLCFVAAQASVIGLGGAVAYSAVAPVASVYRAPVAYSSYVAAAPVVKSYAPAVYSAAPTVYSAPLVKSVYAAAPAVYAAPSVYTTLLKK